MRLYPILLFIFNLQTAVCQNVIEVAQPAIPDDHLLLFKTLRSYRDSAFTKSIEILENGLDQAASDYEKYRIMMNLGFLYTQAEEYDKCIDMWRTANDQGICFPFDVNEPFPSYLSDYFGNSRFNNMYINNDSLRNKASDNAKAEYFVDLPDEFIPGLQYPLIILLHGGIGDFHNTYLYWNSASIRDHYISVYPRGRDVKGSFARRFGSEGMRDIAEIYRQVVKKYPVDTTQVILAGQSAGGALSICLSYDSINAAGLLLAFPVKPSDFDLYKAINFRKNNLKITTICGEEDKSFFPGQKRFAELLDSANVEHRFITYPGLGHGFPDDFSEQIDKALLFFKRDDE